MAAVLFAGDGTLFEYDEAERQWRERGRGEMKVCCGVLVSQNSSAILTKVCMQPISSHASDASHQ